jgi:hypothetical protein
VIIEDKGDSYLYGLGVAVVGSGLTTDAKATLVPRIATALGPESLVCEEERLVSLPEIRH